MLTGISGSKTVVRASMIASTETGLLLLSAMLLPLTNSVPSAMVGSIVA